MDSEKFKKIEEIYHAVLDVALAERETFLAKECGDDIDLRHEIESLLSFNDKEGFVNVSPDFIAAEMFSERETAELIGKIIGHYEILSLLGKGGMGEVYLAQDLKLNRQVAIKFLPNQLIANTKRTNRFIREAQAASALNHPNILTIHEIGWSDETHFIVTEYIEGKTLRETMNTERLSLKQTFKIAIQIASG
ncbi:MAG: serine/threonine-protein kinase, partial [Acidobacteriota bacterium]